MPYACKFKIHKKTYVRSIIRSGDHRQPRGCKVTIPMGARKAGEKKSFQIPFELISGKTKLKIKLGPAVVKWNGKNLRVDVMRSP